MNGQRTDDETCRARNGKNEEKPVIFFKKAVFVRGVVVIFVPAPQPAMHQIFMSSPGYEFHCGYCRQRDENIKQNFHF